MNVEPQTISVREGMFQVPVYRAGKGDPLLVLHNASGLGRGFTPDMEALSLQYEVIAPVLPGFDDTPGLERIDDVQDLVIFLQDFCDAAGLRTFNLLGHSFGGMIAAEFAAARPDLVRKLVLAAPLGFWLDEAPVADLFATLPNELPGLIFGDIANPAVAAYLTPPTDLDALAQMLYLQMANFAAAGKFMWPIPDKGLKKRIHRIGAHTLVLWGESDRLAPMAYGAVFQSKIRRAQLTTFPGIGHMLPIEDTQNYVAEITAFLG